MRELILNAADWQCRDDLYDAFFLAVGAPAWHGRNFNALRDSILGGDINQLEIPYRIRIQNSSLAGEGARSIIVDFVDLLQDLALEGCPVQVEIEP